MSPDDANAAITARGLTRTFGEVTAVDALDLTIHRGEIYGLLGPNGAGKSTTIKMLCTLLSPSSGEAKVADLDVARQPNDVRLRIGVALQDVASRWLSTGAEIMVDARGDVAGDRVSVEGRVWDELSTDLAVIASERYRLNPKPPPLVMYRATSASITRLVTAAI